MLLNQGKRISEIHLGDKASFTKQITESDVQNFAKLSGDMNLIHLDQEYARQTLFKERIAHGMLTASTISAVLGNQLPGPGSVLLSQSFRYIAPVKLGDFVRAEVEVIEIITEKNHVRLKTVCYNQNNNIVIDGEALVFPRR